MITLLNLGLSIIYQIYVEYITGMYIHPRAYGYIILETLWSAIRSWNVIYVLTNKSEREEWGKKY